MALSLSVEELRASQQTLSEPPRNITNPLKNYRSPSSRDRVLEFNNLPALEKVCKDTFIKAKHLKPIHVSSNTLSRRLQENMPSSIENETFKRIKRESLKEFVHLDKVIWQFATDMFQKNFAIEKETSKLLKRQENLKKQTELHKKNLQCYTKSTSKWNSAPAKLPLIASFWSNEANRRDSSTTSDSQHTVIKMPPLPQQSSIPRKQTIQVGRDAAKSMWNRRMSRS